LRQVLCRFFHFQVLDILARVFTLEFAMALSYTIRRAPSLGWHCGVRRVTAAFLLSRSGNTHSHVPNQREEPAQL